MTRPGIQVGVNTAKTTAITPMINPAAIATPSPRRETAPIVPLGTFRRRLVINLGLLLLKTPTSLARVSAVVVATAPTNPPKRRKGQPASNNSGTDLAIYIAMENIIGIIPLPNTFTHDLFPFPS